MIGNRHRLFRKHVLAGPARGILLEQHSVRRDDWST